MTIRKETSRGLRWGFSIRFNAMQTRSC